MVERGLRHANAQTIINIDQRNGAGLETLRPHLQPSVRLHNLPLPKVDTNAPQTEGLYLSINSFHQLPPQRAAKLLTTLAKTKQPIAVVEGNNDSLWQVVGMLCFVPLTMILAAPFVRPFRWSRLLFTYLIPILPLVTSIDGFLALFKLYAPRDLDELVARLHIDHYTWESGKMDNGRGGKIIYLLGLPRREETAAAG